jgi:hypothetical protein
MNGTDAQEALLERDYLVFLHRPIDLTGLQLGLFSLQHGMSESTIIAGLVASDEYFAL